MSLEEAHGNGVRTFAELVPDGAARLDTIFRLAPGLAELAVGTVYGHLHHRTALDPRMREAASLAAIIASGMHGTPLAVHTRTALASGLAPGEIVEIVLQAAAFAGFPRAVSALPVIEQVFAESEIPIPPPPTPRQLVLELLEREPLSDGVAEVRVCGIGSEHAVAVLVPDGSSGAQPTVLYARCQESRVVESRRMNARPSAPAETGD